jgi:hypothetical protein
MAIRSTAVVVDATADAGGDGPLQRRVQQKLSR